MSRTALDAMPLRCSDGHGARYPREGGSPVAPGRPKGKDHGMILDAKIDEQAGTLTLVLKLQEPTPSASGKTLVVASTHGNVPIGVKIDGHDVIVGVNAYIKK
jgi:hypothetical protein